MAITVARRKVHLRVCACRIGAKNWFGETDAFDEAAPVDRRKQPHARDDVAYRHLRGGLALMFKLNNLLDALTMALRLAIDPFDERRHVWVLVAQTPRQLNNEGATCLFPFFELLNEAYDNGSLLFVSRHEQVIGKPVGFFTLFTGRHRSEEHTSELQSLAYL